MPGATAVSTDDRPDAPWSRDPSKPLNVDPVAAVVDCGGIASTAELRSFGAGRRRLTELVAGGHLRRPRLGWYSTLPPDHPRYRAVRIGGRLTGLSALAELGAWMLRAPERLEVAVARGSARLRADRNAVVHWAADRTVPESAAVVGCAEALVRVTLDHDLETSVPCIDWAFASGRLDRFSFEQFILALPASARCIREWVDPRSQSVLESVARVRLRRSGWSVRSQVRVGDLEAIDLVVGDVVALELDGRKHHEATFEADRRKDLSITIEGRHAIRVSYAMLVHDWRRIALAIASAANARGHGPAQDSVTRLAEPRGSRYATGAGRMTD